MFRKTLFIPLAIIAASTVLTGCVPMFIFGGGNGQCQIQPNDVHESTRKPGQMGGKAKMTCNVSVTDARLEVQLEEQRGQAWVAVANNLQDTGKTAPDIGALPANSEATRQVYVICVLGTYRLAARGSAALNGVPSSSANWQYSNPITDPCEH